jgi:hypothetical protein
MVRRITSNGWFWLALSLCLHCFVSFFVWEKKSPAQSVRPVELIEVPKEPDGIAKRAGRPRSRLEALTLRDLGISPEEEVGFSSGHSSAPETTGSGDEGTYRGNGFAAHLSDTGIHSYLYELIDEHLDYPDEFKDKGIQGSVKVTFSINAEGFLEKGSLKMDSASRYLKVFVHRVLRKTFENPVPLSKRPSSYLYARFDFEILPQAVVNSQARASYDRNQSLIQKKRFFVGNHFSFYRSFNPWSDFHTDIWADAANNIHVDPKFNLFGIVESAADLLSSKAKADPLQSTGMIRHGSELRVSVGRLN